MNHAYRYWNRINWYPTYYVSVDHEMNTYFSKDIYKLVKFRKENGIKKFLLSRVILEFQPKLKKAKHASAIYFIEDLEKKSGTGFPNSTYLKTAGSISTRFAIFLNYQKIYILGIDANYQPFNIKWAKSITNSDQRLIKTVNPEPTYFFVGYRSKGDFLHIPPKRRWKKRPNHYLAFVPIHKKYNLNNNQQPRVINCNNISILYHNNILPYQPFPDEFLPSNIDKSKLKLERRLG